MSPTAPVSGDPRRVWRWLAGLAFGAMLIGGALAWWPRASVPPPAATVSPAPLQIIGAANACRGVPAFLSRLGIHPGSALSTSERRVRGLVIREPRPDGGMRLIQPEDWKAAGPMAGFVISRTGAIWLVPVPHVSQPPELARRQQTVWRVDPETAAMAPALDLPDPAPLVPGNPYGTLGIALDCEGPRLYVSSVAGSTREQIRGRIHVLEMASDESLKPIGRVDGVDAFGLAVVVTDQGRRLIWGDARDGSLSWVALDERGLPTGDRQRVGSIAGRGPDGDDRPRRLDVLPGGLRVHGTPFRFNLQQPPTSRPAYHYNFRWDAARGVFDFVDTEVHGGR